MDTSHGDLPAGPSGPSGPGAERGSTRQGNRTFPAERPQILPPGHELPPAPGSPAAPGPPPAPSGGPDPVEHAFAPPSGMFWMGVSPRFTLHQRVSVLVGAVPVAAVGGFLISRVAGTVGTVLWILAVLISCGLGWIIAELAYRSWGYAEREDDLLVVQGVFVKRLVVVPYGRMQFVDVTAGLLEQWMGLATVRLHTAAAASDARIPGLPTADAALLRDRLTHKGEVRSMGL